MNPSTNPRPYLSERLRRRIAVVAAHRCGYCLTAQEFTAMPMHVEHILPLAAGGTSAEENLWLKYEKREVPSRHTCQVSQT